MKNIFKVKRASLIIAFVVIAVLTVVSCAQPVEEAELDWTGANTSDDPTLNSTLSGGYLTYAPTITAAGYETTTTGTGTGTTMALSGYSVTVNFPQDADILKGTIDVAAIDKAITFHNFTKAAADSVGVADTLGSKLTVQIVSRNGQNVTLWIPVTGVSYNTTTGYSNQSPLVAKVGSGYTYKNGLKLDVDGNGVIEEGYDDYYISTGQITNAAFINNIGLAPANTQQNNNFVAPGQKDWYITLQNLPNAAVYATAAAATTANATGFYFVGNTDKTTSYRLTAAQITLTVPYTNINSTSTTADRQDSIHKIFKDVGDLFTSGIKLQNFKDGSWSNVSATAEVAYDTATSTVPTGYTRRDGYYIVFPNVSFERDVPYRIIWEGDGAKKAGTFFGVAQKVYVDGAGTDWAKYTGKKVEGTDTVYNNQYYTSGKLYLSSSPVTTSVYSQDINGQNVVLSLRLNSGYYWNDVTLATVKENFKIGYSRSGNYNGNYYAIRDLVNIDIVDVKIVVNPVRTQVIASTSPTTTYVSKNNIVLVTLDPNYKIDTSKSKRFWISDKLSVSGEYYDSTLATPAYVFRDYFFGGNSYINQLYDRYASYGPISGF